jgi:hypothetical protein
LTVQELFINALESSKPQHNDQHRAWKATFQEGLIECCSSFLETYHTLQPSQFPDYHPLHFLILFSALMSNSALSGTCRQRLANVYHHCPSVAIASKESTPFLQ